MLLFRALTLPSLFSVFFNSNTDPSIDDKWWNHAIIYQIYPRSFKDSNGDGTGDIKGIQSKLDYFVELGIDAIWISPIYKSPMKDFGYDVSDFRDVDPLFGTLEEFKFLLADAHKRGLRIVMDFVPNHSSDEHEWFRKSVKKVEPYTDYYVWKDPKGFDAHGNPMPPNNWVSVFRGSAWEYNEERGQFYLHQFVPGQPDLNYRNPAVLRDMKAAMKFWLDLGVDGFRMDAIAFIWEHEDFPDNTDVSGITNDTGSYLYWNHTYTYNLPETRTILAEFDELIKSYDNRVNMLEVYLPTRDIQPYYDVGDFPFNFDLIFFHEASAEDTLKRISTWLKYLPEGKQANWVTGNHDRWRIGNRIGQELVDVFNAIIMTLPGVVVTYQGEEIGMSNTQVSYENTVDPAGCNCGPERYDDVECSRDPERTPFHWSGTDKNAGFSDGPNTWLPINSNYVHVNVETERSQRNSHLNIYKTLVSIRRTFRTLKDGTFEGKSKKNVLAFSRRSSSRPYPILITVANFNGQDINVDFDKIFDDAASVATVILSTKESLSMSRPGSRIRMDNINLRAHEGLILKLEPCLFGTLNCQ